MAEARTRSEAENSGSSLQAEHPEYPGMDALLATEGMELHGCTKLLLSKGLDLVRK